MRRLHELRLTTMPAVRCRLEAQVVWTFRHPCAAPAKRQGRASRYVSGSSACRLAMALRRFAVSAARPRQKVCKGQFSRSDFKIAGASGAWAAASGDHLESGGVPRLTLEEGSKKGLKFSLQAPVIIGLSSCYVEEPSPCIFISPDSSPIEYNLSHLVHL